MAAMSAYRKYINLFGIAAVIVVVDQLTKAWVGRSLPLYDSFTVIPGFFNIVHLQNPGGAFGLLANQGPGVRKFFFLFVSSLAVIVILFLHRRTPRSHPWLAFGLSLIFGGAIGNLIDRFRFGKVVDFLDFSIGGYHWPAFNIADSAITVGIIIFIVHLVFNKLPKK